MTGNDNVFDMDAALVRATEIGRQVARDTFTNHDRLLEEDGEVDEDRFRESFAACCQLVFRQVMGGAMASGASYDEAVLVGRALMESAQATFSGGAQ